MKLLKIIIATGIMLLQVACQESNDCNHTKEGYKLIDDSVKTDCHIYKMVFDSGKYIFRYALSGPCKDLSQNDYINEYVVFLEKHGHEMKLKKGLILFAHYANKDETAFIDSLKHITANYYKREVVLNEKLDGEFLLEVK